MAEVVSRSGTVAREFSWLQLILRVGRRLRRGRAARRLDDQAWSSYMLRDIGLGEGHADRGLDPRDIPPAWPLR
jgi:hypothetical protein